jgi:hypothetical protein
MRQKKENLDSYAVILYSTEQKYQTLIGVADPESKTIVPHKFTLENALEYLENRISQAIQRGYSVARIHRLENGEIREPYRTFHLSWKEISNDTTSKREL